MGTANAIFFSNDGSHFHRTIGSGQVKLNDIKVDIDEAAAKNAIEAAKLRTQIKKLEKQLAVRADDNRQVLAAFHHIFGFAIV